MEALSASVFLPTFPDSHSIQPAASLRVSLLSSPKTTLVAAASRQLSAEGEDDQQIPFHNVFDFVPQEASSSSYPVQLMFAFSAFSIHL